MKLHEALGIDLKRIDEQLLQVMTTDPELPADSIIAHRVRRLIRAGGKRLRPMMVIVGSRFGSVSCPDKVMRTAVLLEYMHMASLVHDDIIDCSDMRRGMPALHIATDVRSAIHIANYMMARAVEWTMIDPDSTQHCLGLASVVTHLCLGEYNQLHNRYNFDITLEQYLQKTNEKTAYLMATCFKAGAEAAEADEEIVELLFEFGEALGMAFQIRDDVLDFVRSSTDLGKPAGHDLKNGNVTLPVLFALEIPELAARIRKVNASTPHEHIASIVEQIADSDAMERTLSISTQYLMKAHNIIRKISDHPAHQDLDTLLQYFMK